MRKIVGANSFRTITAANLALAVGGRFCVLLGAHGVEQAGLHEHRYTDHKANLAKDLAAVTPQKVQEAARIHLTIEKAAVCNMRSVGP